VCAILTAASFNNSGRDLQGLETKGFTAVRLVFVPGYIIVDATFTVYLLQILPSA